MNFPQYTLPSNELDMMIGLVGLLILVAGTRFYKLTLMAPGFLIGALVAINYGNVLGLPPAAGLDPRLMVGFLLGGAAAVALVFLEHLAVALTGALAGGALVMIVGPMVAASIEWYVPFIGALFGAIAFPALYRRLLVPTTALLGAACVAHALSLSSDTLAVGFLWIFGTGVQWFFRRAPSQEA